MKTHNARRAAGATILCLAVGAACAAPAEPNVAEPTNGHVVPGAQDNFDPVYNVCRGAERGAQFVIAGAAASQPPAESTASPIP